MSRTKIEWVARSGTIPESWSPVTGCNVDGKRVRKSPGCDHCWAERMARRLAGRFGYPEQPHHFDVTLRPDRLGELLRPDLKPRTVFVCSMGDWMHPFVPIPFRAKMLQVMEATPQHTYLTLTKRVHEMRDYILEHQMDCSLWPASNIWLGVSIENQQAADERRDDFEQTPAAVKFVSYEPALSSVDWTGWEFVDQIISGGESGPGARPSHPDWHRVTRDFCQRHNIAYFMKQWGAWLPFGQGPADVVSAGKQIGWLGIEGQFSPEYDTAINQSVELFRSGKRRAGRLLDGREWNEWPGTPPYGTKKGGKDDGPTLPRAV